MLLVRAVSSLRNRTSTIAKQVTAVTRSSIAALDPRTRETIKQIKGVPDTLDDAEIVLKQMKNNSSIALIQAAGCEKLSNVAVREAVGLVHLGVVDVVLKAMKQYSKNPSVQEFACQLIWNLAIVDEHKKLLADGDAPKLICVALENHKGKASVMHKAIGAVKLLSLVEAGKEQLVEEGVVEKIIEVMKEYCNEESDYTDFQETCLLCVQNFAFGKTLVPKLYELGVSTLIADVMTKYEESDEIQSSGAAALWNLALGVTDEQLIEMTDVGITNILIYALKAFAEHQQVVLHSMGALKNLSRVPDSLQLIKEKALMSDKGIGNIYDILMEAFYAHQEDANIVRIGEELLSEFDDEDDEDDNEERTLKTETIELTAEQINDPFADLEATAGGDDDDDYL